MLKMIAELARLRNRLEAESKANILVANRQHTEVLIILVILQLLFKMGTMFYHMLLLSHFLAVSDSVARQ